MGIRRRGIRATRASNGDRAFLPSFFLAGDHPFADGFDFRFSLSVLSSFPPLTTGEDKRERHVGAATSAVSPQISMLFLSRRQK